MDTFDVWYRDHEGEVVEAVTGEAQKEIYRKAYKAGHMEGHQDGYEEGCEEAMSK